MAVITVDKLGKRYAGAAAPAVVDVSFTVADREFMVLLGPSGCGKSTVLRMIAGLEPISSGTVSIDGRVVNQVPAKSRDIAMVFQSYALYPHMSVYDNLAFGLRRRDVERAEIARRVEAAAAKLRLTEFLERKPYALSGGQRQRVALGRAIVRDPKLFLFDEPLSNLDAALRVTTRNELIRQQREIGTTSIYVTHDQVEAMTMGDRVCIMNEGRVVQIGAPLDVYRNPADMFVARFLGNPPMNLLKGRIEAREGRLFALVGREGVALPLGAESSIAAGADRNVIVGIRPEDLYESTPPGDAARIARLPARVTAVEPLGAETLLVMALDGSDDEVTARIGRDTKLARGDRLDVAVDTDAIHLFDPGTTKAIIRRSDAKERSELVTATSVSKPLRVALAGAGMISWYHLTAWRKLGERVRLVAVCDPDVDKATRRAREFDIPNVYRDADAMFAAEAIDALDVASPRETHAAWVEAAAARGIDVLCQKPMTPTFAESEALVLRVGEPVASDGARELALSPVVSRAQTLARRGGAGHGASRADGDDLVGTPPRRRRPAAGARAAAVHAARGMPDDRRSADSSSRRDALPLR